MRSSIPAVPRVTPLPWTVVVDEHAGEIWVQDAQLRDVCRCESEEIAEWIVAAANSGGAR